ncbi:MAG: hypothetical protein Q7U53_03250 [Anaerolineaceae bacterium]|nr:hypothetical protein [Anaerolineaceae bacterium]
MNKKFRFQPLVFLITILIVFLLPNDIVWGGLNFQTVPTIGPSRTPTIALTATVIQPTNTQAGSTQPSSQEFTVTNTIAVQIPITSTKTVKASTQQPAQSSPTPVFSNTVVVSETLDSKQNATSSISLPLVSSGENDINSLVDDQSDQEVSDNIPAFVFPVLIVLFLLIFYFIVRLTIKKPQNNQPPK